MIIWKIGEESEIGKFGAVKKANREKEKDRRVKKEGKNRPTGMKLSRIDTCAFIHWKHPFLTEITPFFLWVLGLSQTYFSTINATLQFSILGSNNIILLLNTYSPFIILSTELDQN